MFHKCHIFIGVNVSNDKSLSTTMVKIIELIFTISWEEQSRYV